MLTWMRSFANAILGKTDEPDRVDTTTRMAMDDDFSRRGKPSMPERGQALHVDPIGELIRIVGERGKELPPRRPKVLPFQRRRRGR